MAHCDIAVLPVKSSPSGTLPLAGPDVLVVMCIGGGVNTRSDSFTGFHSLKKIEYKSIFLGNGCTKVGYLFKAVMLVTHSK